MLNTKESEIERELGTDERLLWSGQPLQGLRLQRSDAALIPFSLLWCGFAVFWETIAINSDAPFFFKLFGVPFVLIGLYMVVGRFFADARRRARTYYGVTTERIIIVKGGSSRETNSLQLRTLNNISLAEHTDRSGTISFGPLPPASHRFPAGFPGAEKYTPPSFEMTEGAKDVYDLIRNAQNAV